MAIDYPSVPPLIMRGIGAAARWIALALGLGALFLILGYLYYRADESRERLQAYTTLAAVGKLKADEVAAWRDERRADARMIAFSPFFADAVKAFLASPGDSALYADLSECLSLVARNRGFDDIIVIDPSGKPALCFRSGTGSLPDAVLGICKRSLAIRDACAGDCYLLPDGGVRLDMAAPIAKSGTATPVGFLVLRSDPSRDLFALVDSWTVPAKSAETMLVSREGGKVIVINPLPARGASALNLSFDLSETGRVAVKAALGARGLVEGVNYRGHKAVSAITDIPGSNWIMIAMEDRDEVLAAALLRGRLIVAVSAFLALLSGLCVWGLALRQRKNLYKDLLRTEAERAATLGLFRTTVYSIGDGVITTDAEGRIKHLNAAAETLTGWAEGEAIGRHISEVFKIVAKDSGLEADDPVRKVLREGSIVQLADFTLLISRDGVERPITDSGSPIRSPSGEIIGVVLVFRDQTEQRRAETALRRSEAFFRELFAHLTVGVSVYEPSTEGNDFIIKDINLAGQAFSKIDIAEVTGKSIQEVFPGVEELGLLAALQEVARNGEPQSLPVSLYHDDRLSEWVENSVFRLPSGEVVAIYHDMTVQKEAEAGLKAALEQREALLHEVHHRVKNNLQLISSLLSLQIEQLESESDGELYRESIQRVMAIASIHEMLYNSGDFILVNLSTYIKELVSDLEEAYGREYLYISVDSGEEELRIDMTKAISCGLIVNELVTNAFKHAFPEGKPGTILVLSGKDEASSRIYIFIKDDGRGFVDLAGAAPRKGLGLRLVDSLVRQLEGNMTMENDMGLGVRIEFKE